MDILLKTIGYLMDQVFSLVVHQNKIIRILQSQDLVSKEDEAFFNIEKGKHSERLKNLIEVWNKGGIKFPFRRP